MNTGICKQQRYIGIQFMHSSSTAFLTGVLSKSAMQSAELQLRSEQTAVSEYIADTAPTFLDCISHLVHFIWVCVWTLQKPAVTTNRT